MSLSHDVAMRLIAVASSELESFAGLMCYSKVVCFSEHSPPGYAQTQLRCVRTPAGSVLRETKNAVYHSVVDTLYIHSTFCATQTIKNDELGLRLTMNHHIIIKRCCFMQLCMWPVHIYRARRAVPPSRLPPSSQNDHSARYFCFRNVVYNGECRKINKLFMIYGEIFHKNSNRCEVIL